MFSTFTEWVDSLLKAAGHKYIKRIPYTSGGKTRYRYIYHVTHTAGGKHVLDPEHMVVNAAFMLSSAKGSEIHAHITKVDGDMVTYRLDDGPKKGELVTESKSKLAERLNEAHGVHEALAGAREKQAKVVADLKARGASEKQIAREQARLERLSAATPAPEAKSEEPKKRASKKPKSVEPAAEEPKSVEPAAEGRDASNAERRTMAFFDHPEALEVMQRLGLEPSRSGVVKRDTVRYAYDVESVKTTKQTLPYATPEGVTEHEYNVLTQFDNPMFALYVEDGRIKTVVKSGEHAGQAGTFFKIKGAELRVLLHMLASDPQIVAQFASVQDIAGMREFKSAVDRMLWSAEHRENVSKYESAPTQTARGKMAAVAQLMTTNIEQQRTPPVQNTTGKYASDAAIPKGLQTALKSFVSKDMNRADLLKPFHRDGHMYSTDGMRMIRVSVQSGPAESGVAYAGQVFQNAQRDNKPTVTLDASTAKGIADVCKALGADVDVEVTTANGKTTFRAGGQTFATVDAHTESAPTQRVNAKYLADMLSVEHPITILQNPDARPTSALSAHTANTQQLLMPRNR